MSVVSVLKMSCKKRLCVDQDEHAQQSLYIMSEHAYYKSITAIWLKC